MKLSNRCHYAALALFDIAFHSRGQATQVRQIAERQDIPVRFLEQIFQDLKRAELVDGRRGRNGGYFLRKPPESITIGDIVRATDGPLDLTFAPDDALTESAPESRIASRSGREVPATVWTDIGQRVTAAFDAFTVADLVSRAEALRIQRDEPRLMYFI